MCILFKKLRIGLIVLAVVVVLLISSGWSPLPLGRGGNPVSFFVDKLPKIWYNLLSFRGSISPLSHDRDSHIPVRWK